MTKIGMSAPASEWATRLKEAGPVDARRLFGQLGSPSGLLRTAKAEVAAGRLPVMSFKISNNDWAGVAAGRYDSQLRTLATGLNGLGGQVFATLHHEPEKDGTAANWSKMLAHALPILKGGHTNVLVGPIGNGWWWSGLAQGYTDAEIAQWLPQSVLSVSDVIASDTYQGGSASKPGEGPGPKIVNMSKWASRTAGVKALGLGEFNALNAASMTAAGKAILADPKFSFACVWNSNAKGEWVLTGDKITAFKAIVAASRR